MATETDPASGMTVAMPGSSAGDASWRKALEEKSRLMRSLANGRR
jgi:hypothetical protein